ncbi:MAG: twin-arginine translocase subunit TatC [Coriobacteriales bacterium]|jgi:sec-independent protein translocase protein TatC|nr:twin-arginine translocase subunit TatC [Coriobacteriales bacterium]
MPVGQARMPLFDHIGELRRRMTVIVVALLIATMALYFISPMLILFIVQPVTEYINGGEPVTTLEALQPILYQLDPLGGFSLRFKVALVFGILVTSPIWIWQLLGFFVPALKPNERKWVLPTFFAAVLLFAFGMVFCYMLILDPAFQFLVGQIEDYASVFPNATDYINVILLFEIGFGVAFELPLVVFYLTVFNIVPYKKLRASWRVVYIVLLVVCAMVTPDANPVTMLLMFAAMAVLYEASLFISRIVLARRIARQKAAEAGELDEDEDDDDDDEGDEDEDEDEDEDAS